MGYLLLAAALLADVGGTFGPAPAAPAAAPPAAAAEVVSYDGGRTWVTRAVPGTPAFPTPTREAIYQAVMPSACAGGRCPRRR